MITLPGLRILPPISDIAQVELLARLDGEFLADLRAGLAADEHGVIDEAIRRARDQDGERDPAVGIGGQLRLVVDRVDVGQAALVGGEEAGRPCRSGNCYGRDRGSRPS